MDIKVEHGFGNRCHDIIGLFDKTKPYAQGVYVNFISETDEARIREAYTEDIWNRLVEVKNKYDPANFFRMNQNIKPTV